MGPGVICLARHLIDHLLQGRQTPLLLSYADLDEIREDFAQATDILR